MALFGLLGKKESPPDWAAFFTLKEYRIFIALVHDYFQDQSEEIVIKDGIVLFQKDSHSWPSTLKCGLLNLAQLCHKNSKENWKQIIFQHFEDLQETRKNEADFEEKIANFYLEVV